MHNNQYHQCNSSIITIKCNRNEMPSDIMYTSNGYVEVLGRTPLQREKDIYLWIGTGCVRRGLISSFDLDKEVNISKVT